MSTGVAVKPRGRVILLVALLLSASGVFFLATDAATGGDRQAQRGRQGAVAGAAGEAPDLFLKANAVKHAKAEPAKGAQEAPVADEAAAGEQAADLESDDAPAQSSATLPRDKKTVSKRQGFAGLWTRVPRWAKVLANGLALALLVSLAVKGKQVKKGCETCMRKQRN
ncbi:conserved hypothetical protein [Neospora caninum Liverpool]|uniref:Uncharacterized protein n=1 Tax=Neospora caninum (strain Liverpool) TaxID=572307 RepID=F0VPZ0_NEOCL|nr:conserved hypothetical protein [Neospora caninum Liverpool]CBZ55787.1 conserved hypothetical protein [Neospora caninum Liverpool]CEL70530.1 TPA: hypothetical protein BN1204_062130 [Neospora caninum Liverpool]|eukprot:XP_003885813.1 conserved hypothetical protein [Neospora caninum Liverpool]